MNELLFLIDSPLLESAREPLLLLSQLISTVADETSGLFDSREINKKLDKFKEMAKKRFVTAHKIKAAHYILCAAIDEAYFARGLQLDYYAMTFLNQYHQDNKGGEVFFRILDQFMDDCHEHIDLLYLCFLCLTMGFKGKHALNVNSIETLLSLRKKLFNLFADEANKQKLSGKITSTTSSETDFSHKKRRFFGLKSLIFITAYILSIAYGGFYYLLNNQTIHLKDKISSWNITHLLRAEE